MKDLDFEDSTEQKEREHALRMKYQNKKFKRYCYQFIFMLYKKPEHKATLKEILMEFDKFRKSPDIGGYYKSMSYETAMKIKNKLVRDGIITQVNSPRSKGMLTLTSEWVKDQDRIRKQISADLRKRGVPSTDKIIARIKKTLKSASVV